MNKNSKIFTVLIILALAEAALSVRYRQKNSADSIQIGSILILSGEGASWGEAARNGINMAVKEINAQGGVLGKKISVNYQDDAGNPQKSLSAFKLLAEVDNLHFIIGTSWSITGLPLVELAKANKVVMISPSLGVKEFNEANDYLFNTWPHDAILSQNLADYVYSLGKRRVALFGASNDPWVKDQSNTFKTRFEALGGKVDLLAEPLTSDKDVKTSVLKVKSMPAIDAIVMTTSGYDLTDYNAKAIKEFGINLPLYAITLDNHVIQNCGGACEGLTFLSFLTPSKSFVDKYRQLYKREVEIGADSGYDATMMLAEAIRKTNSADPDAVKNYLANIKTYAGASGNLVSDGKRGFTKAYTVQIVRNGQAVTK